MGKQESPLAGCETAQLLRWSPQVQSDRLCCIALFAEALVTEEEGLFFSHCALGMMCLFNLNGLI